MLLRPRGLSVCVGSAQGQSSAQCSLLVITLSRRLCRGPGRGCMWLYVLTVANRMLGAWWMTSAFLDCGAPGCVAGCSLAGTPAGRVLMHSCTLQSQLYLLRVAGSAMVGGTSESGQG